MDSLNTLWRELPVQTIIGGRTPEGRPYLDQFLRDYKAVFGGSVNAGCPKCLNEYIRKYKSKFQIMSTNSHGYILKKRFNGLQLPNGGEPVNNASLTLEQAKILVDFYGDPAKIFDKWPTEAPAELSASSKKVELQQYLTANGIEFKKDDTNAALWALVAEHKAQTTAAEAQAPEANTPEADTAEEDLTK